MPLLFNRSSKVSSDAPKGTELDAYKKVLGPAKKSCVCHSLMQGIIKALIILIPIGCFILTIWRNSPNHDLGDDDTNETAEKLEIVVIHWS